jgi:hypothetical protein
LARRPRSSTPTSARPARRARLRRGAGRGYACCASSRRALAALGAWADLRVLRLAHQDRARPGDGAGRRARALARADWPLEEPDLSKNEEAGGAEAGPSLLVSRSAGACAASPSPCASSARPASRRSPRRPAPAHLNAAVSDLDFHGPHALTAAAFAGFPALEELDMTRAELGPAGALLLACRRWARPKSLVLRCTHLDDAGLAYLARGVSGA